MDAAKIKAATEAKAKIAEAGLTIWNTRLEALLASGDTRGVIDHLTSPIEDKIDNCGCNVQCGALQEGLAANPAAGRLTRG